MSSLTFNITLAAGITSASVAFAPQKYNKKGWFALQFDDGSHGVLVARNLFKTNPFTYTDGCGNVKTYAGSVGMNLGTGVPGSDYYNAQVLQGNDFRSLIADGFDIENHSFFHAGTAMNPPDDATKQQALTDTIKEDDVIDFYGQYKAEGFIVPTNFNGYADAARQLGYLSCVSTTNTVFDELPFYLTTLPALPGTLPEFLCMVRDYTDTWTVNTDTADFKARFDELVSGIREFYILFTHSGLDTGNQLPVFTDFFTHVQTQSADTVLICSVREALNYRSMLSCPVTQQLTGNTLTVTIDTTNLSDRQRWMDCSFKVTADAPVTGVSAGDFDGGYSYNNATGLINVFKQKTTWGALTVPPPSADPNQSIFLKHGHFVAQ